MTAPPAKTDISGTPTRATARTAFGQLWEYVTERLGGGTGSASSGEQDAAATAMGVVRTTQLCGQRNRLVNGGFQINQRGVTSAADDAYCLDRWYVLTETGSVTVAQQTDQEHGTPYNIRLTQPDASPKRIGLVQIEEAANCKDLRNKITTLAGRLRCSVSTQINYAVLEWTGSADSVTSDFISAWGGSPTYVANITERAKGTLTPSAATWTDTPALSATINTGVNNVIIFVWTNSTLAQNATLDIARMQHEPGAFATPFEFLPIGTVYQQCRRYRRTLSGFSGVCVNATTVQVGVVFGDDMRVTPSASATAAIEITDTSSAYTQSSPSAAIAGGNARGARIQLGNFTGMTSFRPVVDNFGGSIVLDAEL